MRILRTPQAEQARLEIWRYIARDNIDAADRVIRRIDATSKQYARSPLLGERRDDLAPDVRCFHVGKYAVFYKPLDNGILVLTVIHSARDIPTVFQQTFGTGDD
jgi:toxin ParE1/3/4